VQNVKHFDICPPPVLLGQFQHWVTVNHSTRHVGLPDVVDLNANSVFIQQISCRWRTLHFCWGHWSFIVLWRHEISEQNFLTAAFTCQILCILMKQSYSWWKRGMCLGSSLVYTHTNFPMLLFPIYSSVLRIFVRIQQLSYLTLWRPLGMGTTIKHPVPDRVKPSFVIFDIQALWRSGLSVRVLRISKITNDGLTRSGRECFIAVPIWQQWTSKG